MHVTLTVTFAVAFAVALLQHPCSAAPAQVCRDRTSGKLFAVRRSQAEKNITADAASTTKGNASACPVTADVYQFAGINVYDAYWDASTAQAAPGLGLNQTVISLDKAKASNLTIFRFFASPWGPDKKFWLQNATQYWKEMDSVMDLIAREDMYCIPSLGTDGWNDIVTPNETWNDLVINASSLSRQAARRYFQEFVSRYTSHQSVLFWELGNELNLMVDLPPPHCTGSDYCFNTQQMVSFTKDLVDVIRTIDPLRPISSGFSIPRPSAWHQANCKPAAGFPIPLPDGASGPAMDQSVVSPSCGGSGGYWTQDNLTQWQEMLARQNEAVDIWSVHYYGDSCFFGEKSACNNTMPIEAALNTAVAHDKALYVGEYGSPVANYTTSAGRAFANSVLEFQVNHTQAGNSHLLCTTIWSWRCPTHHDNPSCLDPGVNAGTSEMVAALNAANELITLQTSTVDVSGRSQESLLWGVQQAPSLPSNEWVPVSNSSPQPAFTASKAPFICRNITTGAGVLSVNGTCPPGATPFQAAGVNIYDVFWSVWDPSATHGNLTTSLQALRDASALGVKVIRTFAHPFLYTASYPADYWQQAKVILDEAHSLGISVVPSLGYGCARNVSCNPALLFNETYRDLIVNSSSQTRRYLFAYATKFVDKFKDHPAVFLWELGNELSLEFDGCGYDKSDAQYFTTAEGLAFLRDYRDVVKQADPTRLVNTGNSHPRKRAYHLARVAGGGRNCVTKSNPNGDCALCTPVPLDTLSQSRDTMMAYYQDFDLVSIHFYGCSPPFGDYSWCKSNTSTQLFDLGQDVAEALGKPLYVGEFGASNVGPNDGYNNTDSQGFEYAMKTLQKIGSRAIALSTLWAWECPSHDDTPNWCLHPGVASHQPGTRLVVDQLRATNRQLQQEPPLNMTAVLQLLDLDRNMSRCLDGSPYGVYVRPGKYLDRWVIDIQGGGWCYDEFSCWMRSNTTLGSSKAWSSRIGTPDFGPDFADWSHMHLPYCDGSSFSGFRDSAFPVGNASADFPWHDPVPAGSKVYFRGHANLMAALDVLRRDYAKGKPIQEVVVTGGSAGGLSTIIHTDAIHGVLAANVTVGAPVAGYFLDHNISCDVTVGRSCNYTDNMKYMVHMHNATGGLNANCLSKHQGQDSFLCSIGAHAARYSSRPLFFIQSKFDHWQLEQMDGVPCMQTQNYTPPWNASASCDRDDTNAIVDYGVTFMKQFEPALSSPGLERGTFLTSCVLHGLDFRYVNVNQSTVQVAFTTWYRAVLTGHSSASLKWVDDLHVPRTDDPLGCPPFRFDVS